MKFIISKVLTFYFFTFYLRFALEISFDVIIGALLEFSKIPLDYNILSISISTGFFFTLIALMIYQPYHYKNVKSKKAESSTLNRMFAEFYPGTKISNVYTSLWFFTFMI